MKNAVSLFNVVKKYGKQTALDGLTLIVPRGSLFGLVGSNGAGKTTMMSIVAGFTSPDSGVINVLDKGSFSSGIHGGQVSILPQDAQLPRESRVREIMCFYAELQGVPRRQINDHVDELLVIFHLADRGTSQIRTLSHGMMRRLTIAQAFLGNPELVMLDEPFSGLDPREADNARNCVKEKKNQQTIIVSSHNLNDIERLCDMVAFIERGRTILQETIESATSRNRTVSYSVQSVEFDAGEIKKLLPGVQIEFNKNDSKLILVFSENKLNLGDVNAVVTKFFLEKNIKILSIIPGERLEEVYLRQTQNDKNVL